MTVNDLRLEMMEYYSSAEEFFSEEDFQKAYENMLKASKIAKKIADCILIHEDCKEYINLADHYYKKALYYHSFLDDPKKKSVYVMEAPTHGFDDFIGLEDVKEYLKKTILPLWNNHELSKREKNGILIYGPHGVGKSRFVHAFIKELHAKTYFIQPLRHFQMTDFPDVEHSFMTLFSTIEKEDNVVLFIESPVPYFSNGTDDFSKDTSSLFIRLFRNELKRIKRKNLNILLIATTSAPDKMNEKAFVKGLFDDFIRIHLPNENIRSALLDRCFISHPLTKEQKEKLMEKTKGFVTSSVTRLAKEILEAQAFEDKIFQRCLDHYVEEDVSGYEESVDAFEKSIQDFPILK